MKEETFLNILKTMTHHKIGLYTHNESFIEGYLIDVKNDYLVIKVEPFIFYFPTNNVHAISKNAKRYKSKVIVGHYEDKDSFKDVLHGLKYRWVTINCDSSQIFSGLMTKYMDDHILLINKDEQYLIQESIITSLAEGVVEQLPHQKKKIHVGNNVDNQIVKNTSVLATDVGVSDDEIEDFRLQSQENTNVTANSVTNEPTFTALPETNDSVIENAQIPPQVDASITVVPIEMVHVYNSIKNTTTSALPEAIENIIEEAVPPTQTDTETTATTLEIEHTSNPIKNEPAFIALLATFGNVIEKMLLQTQENTDITAIPLEIAHTSNLAKNEPICSTIPETFGNMIENTVLPPPANTHVHQIDHCEMNINKDEPFIAPTDATKKHDQHDCTSISASQIREHHDSTTQKQSFGIRYLAVLFILLLLILSATQQYNV